MYNKWQTGAENGGKVPLASIQVVGEFESLRVREINQQFTTSPKIVLSSKNQNCKVVIDELGNHRRKCLHHWLNI